MEENYRLVEATQKRNQKELQKLLARDKEIYTFVEKLFEEEILGNLSEERFLKLSSKYDDEWLELNPKIRHLESIVCEEKSTQNVYWAFRQKYKREDCLTLYDDEFVLN